MPMMIEGFKHILAKKCLFERSETKGEDTMPDFLDTVRRDPLATKFILVVDDDEGILETLKYILNDAGNFYVITATNGFQALNIVEGVRPDFFLFDYQLPDMNGIELYHRIHADRKFANVPVLFLSANASKAIFEELRLPYLSKPFELQDLLQKIEDLL